MFYMCSKAFLHRYSYFCPPFISERRTNNKQTAISLILDHESRFIKEFRNK